MSNEKNVARAWTSEEEQLLFNLRREGIPYRLIGVEIGRSSRSCERKFNNTLWETKDYYNQKTIDLDEQQKKVALESISRCEDRKLASYKMRADIIADKMVAAITPLQSTTPPPYKQRKKGKTHEDEHMGVMLSDSHIGHCHTMADTGGISEYNLEVFYRRVENFKIAVTDIAELHSQIYRLPVLHIFCNGDIVAGMNAAGSWSSTYINLPIWDQMIHGFHALEGMLYHWLGFFKEVNFYGVLGNHGRAAPLGVEKDYINWDYFCYKYLEKRFEEEKRVKFVIPQAWWMMQTIKNHKFLLIHGHDLRPSASALKSLQTFQEKMIGIIKEIPDYTLAAHFHSTAELTTNNGKLLINGSFMGSDVYSLKTIHAASKPEQKVFGIHSKRGITWTYNIDLDCER